MKNLTPLFNLKNNQLSLICFVLFASFSSTFLHSQEYKNINSYMDDFEKNEMFVKKAIMDYSVTIVESQLETRSKDAAQRIIEKLEKMNSILINTNKGFENNTLIRDSFIKLNQKTIASLNNGSLILNDYEYQSSLSLSEIRENMNRKELEVISYYQELRLYEKNKKVFASTFKIKTNNYIGKNLLEYNAYQNFIFYKINVIDQKLMTLINAKDQVGYNECLNTLESMCQDAITKINLYSFDYKDNSLIEANLKYTNFIYNQKETLTTLFNDFIDEYQALQNHKKTYTPENSASIDVYNNLIRSYNAKKNSFYTFLDTIQYNKKDLYDNWFIINSTFLKKNGEFKDIHQSYVLSY